MMTIMKMEMVMTMTVMMMKMKMKMMMMVMMKMKMMCCLHACLLSDMLARPACADSPTTRHPDQPNILPILSNLHLARTTGRRPAAVHPVHVPRP